MCVVGPSDTPGQLPERIYHLALRDEWAAAVQSRCSYDRSTLGRSLDEQGFIHCSLDHQLQAVADRVYRGRSDVVLLTIDTAKLDAEVRLDRVQEADDRFPHVYGPINPGAVVRTEPVPLGSDGRLHLDEPPGRPPLA